jgi:hypothetical protein
MPACRRLLRSSHRAAHTAPVAAAARPASPAAQPAAAPWPAAARVPEGTPDFRPGQARAQPSCLAPRAHQCGPGRAYQPGAGVPALTSYHPKSVTSSRRSQVANAHFDPHGTE